MHSRYCVFRVSEESPVVFLYFFFVIYGLARDFFYCYMRIYIFGTYIFVELDVLTTADVIDILCERCFSILLVQFS